MLDGFSSPGSIARVGQDVSEHYRLTAAYGGAGRSTTTFIVSPGDVCRLQIVLSVALLGYRAHALLPILPGKADPDKPVSSHFDNGATYFIQQLRLVRSPYYYLVTATKHFKGADRLA